MLSVLPQLLDFQFYGPFILRLALAVIFIAWGWQKFSGENKNYFGWIELLGGAMLLIGIFTQVAALVLFIEYAGRRCWKGESKGWEMDLLIYMTLAAILVLGPGIYAIDYPL